MGISGLLDPELWCVSIRSIRASSSLGFKLLLTRLMIFIDTDVFKVHVKIHASLEN
jgi:hypothetical protein